MRTKIALAAIVGVGAALRFWNISAGLPYRLAVDEPVIAERAIQILTAGNFNPHFLTDPARDPAGLEGGDRALKNLRGRRSPSVTICRLDAPIE